MHEFAVVHSLLAQLEEEVARLGVKGDVTAVHLKLGTLTTFVPEAMTFCFDALKKGTPLAKAALVIHEIPVAGKCRACGACIKIAEPPFICADCGSPALEITSGRELAIDTIEINDGAPR